MISSLSLAQILYEVTSERPNFPSLLLNEAYSFRSGLWLRRYNDLETFLATIPKRGGAMRNNEAMFFQKRLHERS